MNAAEKIKIKERANALFAVGVNIPYFDAAMLDDAGYKAMLDAATEIYQAKQLENEDREKLKDLAMTIRQIISPPAIKSEAAREIVENVLGALAVTADNIVTQSKEL